MSQELTTTEPPTKDLSWSELDWMITIACKKMRDVNYRPSRIIPIGGGGIIPAALMAYRLFKRDHAPVELLPPIYAHSYSDDHKRGALRIDWPEEVYALDASSTLFVDDICDSGTTLMAVRRMMPKSQLYCVITKLKSLPHFYSHFSDSPEWWNFPWERT